MPEVVPGTDQGFSKSRLLVFSLATSGEETKLTSVEMLSSLLNTLGTIVKGESRPARPATAFPGLSSASCWVILSFAGTCNPIPAESHEDDFNMCDTRFFTPKYFSVCFFKNKVILLQNQSSKIKARKLI